MRQAVTRLEGFTVDEKEADKPVSLFRQLSALTENGDVNDTIPALSGVLVRELASAVVLYKAPPGMPQRVLNIILQDVQKAIRDWQTMKKH